MIEQATKKRKAETQEVEEETEEDKSDEVEGEAVGSEEASVEDKGSVVEEAGPPAGPTPDELRVKVQSS